MATSLFVSESDSLLPALTQLHESIRSVVVEACEREAMETLAAVAREEEGDTIYAVDRISEDLIIDFLDREIATHVPVVLIAEGLPGGKAILPSGSTEDEAVWRIIVDPIDGTRGLMYQKRSGWVLSGVAPNLGEDTRLSDIELAIQTEIPLVKQHLSDSVWAIKGKGVHAERFNRLNGERQEIQLRPSQANTIRHGYAQVARFFPGAREELAAIDEEIVRGALGPAAEGKANCFEDQYASSGGQLYELMSGHDRFIADLRPLFQESLQERGFALGICCHPYDLCTEMIAREAGVLVTDLYGRELAAKLEVDVNVGWVGYANTRIREQIEPLLREALYRRNLLKFDDSSSVNG